MFHHGGNKMNKFIESILLPSNVPTGFARRIIPHIAYNSVDISNDLANYLISIDYTDILSGYADDLQLNLEDKDGLWQSAWFPEMGATLEAVIENRYWDSPTDTPKHVQLGIFEIDEIECRSMPSVVTIKSISVPNDTTLRGVAHNRAWEKVSIYKIVEDIAKAANLEVVYNAPENPNIERVEQVEQSDLSFLKKLCEDNGLALKISDKQIIVFDEVELEKAEPSFLFCKNDTVIAEIKAAAEANNEMLKPIYQTTGWSFSSAIRDTYKSCRVEYQEGQKKEKISGTFVDPNKKTGKVLVVSKQVKTVAEAETLAKKELRKKNSEEVKGKLSLQGRIEYAAGLTCEIKGYGVFDGKYLITQASHKIGGGYTTELDIRRCLNGF